MSAGLLKPEKDFTKDADKLIPEAEALAKVRIAYPTTTSIMHTDFARFRPMFKVPSTSYWCWRSKPDRYAAPSSLHFQSISN